MAQDCQPPERAAGWSSEARSSLTRPREQAVDLHGPQFPHCTAREKDDPCSFQVAGPLGDRVTAAAASMAPKEQTTYQGAQSQQFLLTLGLCPAFLPLSAHPLAGGSFIPSHVY